MKELGRDLEDAWPTDVGAATQQKQQPLAPMEVALTMGEESEGDVKHEVEDKPKEPLAMTARRAFVGLAHYSGVRTEFPEWHFQMRGFLE